MTASYNAPESATELANDAVRLSKPDCTGARVATVSITMPIDGSKLEIHGPN